MLLHNSIIQSKLVPKNLPDKSTKSNDQQASKSDKSAKPTVASNLEETGDTASSK